jgi:hypothetical protein
MANCLFLNCDSTTQVRDMHLSAPYHLSEAYYQMRSTTQSVSMFYNITGAILTNKRCTLSRSNYNFGSELCYIATLTTVRFTD